MTWQFDAMTTAPTAFDCSSRGVGSIAVSMQQSGVEVAHDLFPCDAQPATEILAPGTYDFVVTGSDFGGAPLLAPVTIHSVSIVDGQTTAFAVRMTRNPQCADGVDNDEDGLVDLADPGCGGDPKGDDEAAK